MDKSTFQAFMVWSEHFGNRTDAVMVYGVGGDPSGKGVLTLSLEDRSASERACL